MVRNVNGGGNAKRQARKHQSSGSNNYVLRKSTCELELYACVTKMWGGNLCQVMTQNGDDLKCHMGGKFRGRNRRHNIVSAGSWVLVGLREWEKKLENCDLEYVYERDEIEQLRNLPGINLKKLISESSKLQNIDGTSSANINDDDDDDEFEGFTFSNSVVTKDDVNRIIEGNMQTVTIHADAEINIDDI